MSELEKVAYSVVPMIIYMNIVIGIYIYRVLNDPENYKKDPPLVIRRKKDWSNYFIMINITFVYFHTLNNQNINKDEQVEESRLTAVGSVDKLWGSTSFQTKWAWASSGQ